MKTATKIASNKITEKITDKIALFPGSFDPPTNGHIDLICRASKIFDKVDVVIGVNIEKKYMFTLDERLVMMKKLVKDFGNVSIHFHEGLITEYAKKTGACVILRGVRNNTDFSYEHDMSIFNTALNPNVETVFLPSSHKNTIISSSAIKQLVKFGASISDLVPQIVEDAIYAKQKKSKKI